MEALEETLERRDADFILSSATQPHGLYWGDTARASNTTTSVSTLWNRQSNQERPHTGPNQRVGIFQI